MFRFHSLPLSASNQMHSVHLHHIYTAVLFTCCGNIISVHTSCHIKPVHFFLLLLPPESKFFVKLKIFAYHATLLPACLHFGVHSKIIASHKMVAEFYEFHCRKFTSRHF
ncbi:hypothetical protein ILYODFUR_030461 [Ilyodon furcidens]|uniref:Uncharacterized protein n=1 Tax=Ilyodon furcidens TaxID=33524 RepID=A0ABV0SQG8_9TELE